MKFKRKYVIEKIRKSRNTEGNLRENCQKQVLHDLQNKNPLTKELKSCYTFLLIMSDYHIKVQKL